MGLILFLFIVGIVLIVLEVLMPGAVLGVIGGISMFAGCALAFSRFGLGGGLIATLVALAILGVALYLEFYLIPRTRLGRQLFVHSSNTSTSQGPIASDAIIGREAVAATTLAPSGYVLVDGRRYEAFSQAGHIEQGEKLVVSGRDNFRLIVNKSSSS